MMLISREFLIPKFLPTLNGHIEGDPQLYNQIALKKADVIRKNGLFFFELRPEGQGPAGIASLAYLLSPNPYIIVLLNSLLHTLASITMILILRFWFTSSISIIGSIPFIVSPYLFFWFSQLNKDSFTIAGSLLFIFGFLKITSTFTTSLKKQSYDLIIPMLGIIFIWVMRPYINQMLLMLTIFILPILLFLKKNNYYNFLKFLISGILLIILLKTLNNGAASDYSISSLNDQRTNNLPIKSERNPIVEKCFASISSKNWNNEVLVPDNFNNYLRALMRQRCFTFTILEKQTNFTTIHSMIETDHFPNGTIETFKYLPRSLLNGLLAPYPNRWMFNLNHNFSIFYAIVPFECCLLYVGIPCLFILIIRRKFWSLLIPIFFSLGMITITALANPYLGVLYRYRYPWWMLLLCLGTSGILELFKYKNRNIYELNTENHQKIVI